MDAKNLNHWHRLERAIAYFTFCYKDQRKQDYDNCLASIKPLLDGIVDARLLVDDDHQHLRIGGVEIKERCKDEGVSVALVECAPHVDIRPDSELLTFLVQSCGGVHDCETCPLRGECVRVFNGVVV